MVAWPFTVSEEDATLVKQIHSVLQKKKKLQKVLKNTTEKISVGESGGAGGAATAGLSTLEQIQLRNATKPITIRGQTYNPNGTLVGGGKKGDATDHGYDHTHEAALAQAFQSKHAGSVYIAAVQEIDDLLVDCDELNCVASDSDEESEACTSRKVLRYSER